MGLSLSLLYSAWEEILKHRYLDFGQKEFSAAEIEHDRQMTIRAESFKKIDSETNPNPKDSGKKLSRKNSINLTNCEPVRLMLETSLSFKNLVQDLRKPESSPRKSAKSDGHIVRSSLPSLSLPEPVVFFSPRPVNELDAAAVKLQKVYKSYRTRRNLADCAVVVEELWWKALDFAALKRSSVSFFDVEKQETVISKWSRARTRAAKVGKGLSKDEKAQKLALQHWLEAIDPRHRYGHNLHFYYDIWFKSESSQPFFYWLDVGDGKEINLEKCPRANLQHQCIKYLGPKERESYEVILENGKLVYRISGDFVNTVEGSKWIFVLSTSRNFYVGQKKKGVFQHSSFLAGAAITAAGRLVARDGVLEAIWPYSGHYHPTEENFREFISFLEENSVNLSNVKKCAIDDDLPSFNVAEEKSCVEAILSSGTLPQSEDTTNVPDIARPTVEEKETITISPQTLKNNDHANKKPPVYNLGKHLSCKWSTGNGPRISCVRDYPAELQFRALEQVNLSPRLAAGPYTCSSFGPIPSPRPSPKIRLSPRLSYMGLPSPRAISAAN